MFFVNPTTYLGSVGDYQWENFNSKGTKTLRINPLNWKTDSTVAPKTLNKGACTVGCDGTISKEQKNFTGTVINPNRGMLNLTDVNLGSVPEKVFYDYNKQDRECPN